MAIIGNYDVLDVSRHIINYSNKKNIYIDNLKLQKLLYFIQANFLYLTDGATPCFKEFIVAWQYGPVVIEAYHEFKFYGSSIIPEITTISKFDISELKLKKIPFKDPIKAGSVDAQIIDSTIDFFKNTSGLRMVEITHNQKPWKEAMRQGKGSIITNDEIYKFFKED